MSVVATVEQLEAIYGVTNDASTVKVADHVTPLVQRAGPGGEDERTARGDRRVRVGNTVVQATGTDEVDGHSQNPISRTMAVSSWYVLVARSYGVDAATMQLVRVRR